MNNKLLRVFTGTEVELILLKGALEDAGVSALVKDDFNSSISAGFFAGSPSSLDLFIAENDLEKASPIIQEFIDSRDTAGQ